MNYAPKVTKTISYQTYRSKLMGQSSFHITSGMWIAWSHFRPSRFWADLWFDLKTWKSTAMTNSSYMMGHMPSENPWLVQINLDLRILLNIVNIVHLGFKKLWFKKESFGQIYDSICRPAMTNSSYMMEHMPSDNPWLVQINLDLRNCDLRKKISI